MPAETSIHFFDRVFATPEEELACDEVLLDLCEERADAEVLRVWQPPGRFVVLGYTNAAGREVDRAACVAAGISVYRRTTGGGAIVQLPGCLNYALVLRQDRHPALATINGTNAHVMGRVAETLSTLTSEPVSVCGHTDLCLGNRKVSGNAQRRRTRALLFHGTLLLHANIADIEQLLPFPSTQPDYRKGRSHADFVRNLNLDPTAVTAALRVAWHAHTMYTVAFEERLIILARSKYATSEWTLRRL